MKITATEITFRIDVHFDGDVDMVLREAAAAGVQTAVPSLLTNGAQISIDESKLGRTPIGRTVDFALHWLAGYLDRAAMCIVDYEWTDYQGATNLRTVERKHRGRRTLTELNELGFEVVGWGGLMQNNCHIELSTTADNYTPENVDAAKAEVERVFSKFVRYYARNRPPLTP